MPESLLRPFTAPRARDGRDHGRHHRVHGQRRRRRLDDPAPDRPDVAAGAAVYAWRQPAVAAALAAAPRPARIAFGVGALALLPQLALLSVFIVDPTAGVWPANVWRPIQSQHSCVSAYWVASRAATRVPNLYVESVYRPPIVRTVRPVPNLGPFIVDVFEYPPTFLPLPRLLGLVSPDFWTFRRLWFALNLAGVAVGLVAIGRRLDTRLGTPAVWLTPFALASPAVVGTLQAGNVQLLFIVSAAVAMLLFERRQHAAGGLLLGYAIAAKLFPCVLLLFLLLRRDWRALGWTAAVGAALVLVTLADVGWTPFAAFFDNLPKLLSGEAFPRSGTRSRTRSPSTNQFPAWCSSSGSSACPTWASRRRKSSAGCTPWR